MKELVDTGFLLNRTIGKFEAAKLFHGIDGKGYGVGDCLTLP